METGTYPALNRATAAGSKRVGLIMFPENPPFRTLAGETQGELSKAVKSPFRVCCVAVWASWLVVCRDRVSCLEQAAEDLTGQRVALVFTVDGQPKYAAVARDEQVAHARILSTRPVS